MQLPTNRGRQLGERLLPIAVRIKLMLFEEFLSLPVEPRDGFPRQRVGDSPSNEADGSRLCLMRQAFVGDDVILFRIEELQAGEFGVRHGGVWG